MSQMSHTSEMLVRSSNSKFWRDFIDWMNDYPDGKGTTLVMLPHDTLRPVKVFEGLLVLESIDDGGQARIATLSADDGMFVRVQSWDESANNKPEIGHVEFRKFEGKKVRITLEVIE